MKTEKFQLLSLGVFVTIGIFLLWIFHQSLSQKIARESGGYTLYAVFQDLKQIQTGDDVRVAGVKVGLVQDVTLKSGKPTLSLMIEDGNRIPHDSIASIDMISLLGGNYVNLSLGSLGAPNLKEGDRILTRSSSDLNSIMRSIGNLGERLTAITEPFDPNSKDDRGMGALFAKLNELVDENESKIETILDNLQSATNKLDKGDGTFAKLLNDPIAYSSLTDTLEEFQEVAHELKSLASDARAMIEHVKSGEGTLGQLVYNQDISDSLKRTVNNFEVFSEKLNTQEGTLGKLVNDDALYKDLRAVLNKAERTFDSVGDSGPTVAAGVAAQALF